MYMYIYIYICLASRGSHQVLIVYLALCISVIHLRGFSAPGIALVHHLVGGMLPLTGFRVISLSLSISISISLSLPVEHCFPSWSST
jgi:hypothetical protein